METKYKKVLRFAAQMVLNANESQMADLRSALGDKALSNSSYKKREAENTAISKLWFEENYDELYDLLRERPEWFNNSKYLVMKKNQIREQIEALIQERKALLNIMDTHNQESYEFLRASHDYWMLDREIDALYEELY